MRTLAGVATILRTGFGVQTHSPAAARVLWQALKRNAAWIKHFISISDSILDEHLQWLFDRLKDLVPPNATDEKLDQIIRLEVSSIYGRFRDRCQPAVPFSAGEISDPAGRRFESALEDKDELRASLECVPAETRELILSVFLATEDEKRSKNTRTDLAALLGLTRTALDQRLSRAYNRIRERMSGKRGSKKQ
jgi:hypothetical protein